MRSDPGDSEVGVRYTTDKRNRLWGDPVIGHAMRLPLLRRSSGTTQAPAGASPNSVPPTRVRQDICTAVSVRWCSTISSANQRARAWARRTSPAPPPIGTYVPPPLGQSRAARIDDRVEDVSTYARESFFDASRRAVEAGGMFIARAGVRPVG